MKVFKNNKELSMYQIKNELMESLESPIIFFNILSNVRDDDLIKICNLLKEELEVDYFKLAINAINGQYNIFRLSRILEKVSHFSILNMQNILHLYEIIFELMHGDLASGLQYDITKNIATHNKDYAVFLLNEMYIVNKEYTIYHISTILSTLHNSHSNIQYETIKSFLSDSSHIYKTRSAIEAIKNIQLSNEEANEVFELFKKIQHLNNKDLDTELIYSANRLISKYLIFKEVLQNYAISNNVEIKFHISQILMFNSKEHVQDSWFKTCLFSLSDTKVEHKGIINNLGSVLSDILDRADGYNLIKEFIFTWVKNSDISYNFPKKNLETFIRDFKYKHPLLLNRFITESLYSDNSRIHLIISAFVSKKSSLDTNIIDKFSKKDILYICRKILGYIHDFDKSANLIFSILKINNLSDNIKNLVIEVFINHIGKDYSSDTLDYLNKLQNEELNSYETEVINTVVETLNLRNERYKELPRLKELNQPSQQTRLISKANNLSMKKVMETSEEGGLMALLSFKKILINYGKGSFYKQGNSYSKPNYLQSFSTSVTIPNSERAHPIHSAIERYHFRLVKKDEE